MVTHWVSLILAVSRRQTGVRQRISGIHLRQGYGGQDAGNTSAQEFNLNPAVGAAKFLYRAERSRVPTNTTLTNWVKPQED